MDKITRYKKILLQEMEYRASLPFSNAPDLKNHLIVNKDGTEFILLMIGWTKRKYRHGVIFHFEIKGDKVWLHVNHTDVQIGERLAEKGIPKSDIVLGFLSKWERSLEGYAAA